MRLWSWIAAFWLAAAPVALGAAELANPRLTAQIQGREGEESVSTALRIESIDLAVRIHGGTAETLVTARFHNPGQERLEGRFTLQMPEGSVVTGYALDVAGTMVEGVLVDQFEARRAYEARVRERIDPGLGEVTRGFQFNTRVYPIEPGSGRTVRVRFVTPLGERGYELPLAQEAAVGRMSLSVEASGLAAPPTLAVPLGPAPAWTATPTGWSARWSADRAKPDGALVAAEARRSAPLIVGEGGGAETWFELADSAPPDSARPARPRSVAILWDRSLSRGDDLLAEEIAFLEAYLERTRPSRIELVLFDGGGVERSQLEGPASLARRLREVTYRGATSIEAVAAERIEADSCLLFTDGLLTLGRHATMRPGCPLTVVSSAPDSDRAWLGALAGSAGGEALQLRAGQGAALAERLTRAGIRIADIRSASGAAVDYALLEAPAGAWRAVGRMPAGGGLVVRLKGRGDGLSQQTYAAGPAAPWSAAEALWAANRLAVRAASGTDDRDSLIAFARRHSVAGPDISFLVLETPEDYAQSRIEPPASYPAERLAAYREIVRERREDEEEDRKERFDTLLQRWEEQKKWWAQKFDPNAQANPDAKGGLQGAPQPVFAPPPSPVPPPAPTTQTAPTTPAAPASPGNVPVAGGGGSPEHGDIVVTGTQIAQPNLSSVSPVTVVNSEEIELSQTSGDIVITELPQATAAAEATESVAAEWASDRPYMAALRAARPRDRERVLAEQQAKHGALPAFWLDVSDYYHRSGNRGEAVRLLLSALELPTRDSETLGIVAERLMRWGDVETAIALYERMVAVDRQHPHPRRGLALALGKRAAKAAPARAKADLERAIAILAEIVLTVDDDEYEGFDIVALTELNGLIAHYRRLGGASVPLDPRLVANLDLDLRVVLEWKNEQIDVDMWLTEPNDEIASYWNDSTAMGGRLSPETTDGSGPEQYLLRRAAGGSYSLKAEIYSDDPLNPNGTARVIARFIRNFGRPNQREELVEVELLPQKESEDSDDEDAVPVGRIRISR